MNKLRKVLKEKKLTQGAFAKRMGMHQTMVSQIILGKRKMPPERAFQMERLYGVPCEDFVPWLGDLKRMAVTSETGNADADS